MTSKHLGPRTGICAPVLEITSDQNTSDQMGLDSFQTAIYGADGRRSRVQFRLVPTRGFPFFPWLADRCISRWPCGNAAGCPGMDESQVLLCCIPETSREPLQGSVPPDHETKNAKLAASRIPLLVVLVIFFLLNKTSRTASCSSLSPKPRPCCVFSFWSWHTEIHGKRGRQSQDRSPCVSCLCFFCPATNAQIRRKRRRQIEDTPPCASSLCLFCPGTKTPNGKPRRNADGTHVLFVLLCFACLPHGSLLLNNTAKAKSSYSSHMFAQSSSWATNAARSCPALLRLGMRHEDGKGCTATLRDNIAYATIRCRSSCVLPAAAGGIETWDMI